MFHVKHEGSRDGDWLPADSPPLDDLARSRLERFESLLLELAVPSGMVSASDAPRIRERHLVDSLRAVPLLPESGTACDLGSGAGLPGLPLAIARPDVTWVLAEVRRNRAVFIERVIDTLQLENVVVHPRRAETLRQRTDVCTARAFGPARTSWDVGRRLLRPQGRLVYWAGWSFDPSADLPDDAESTLFPPVGLARSGPLVIMTV